MSSNKTVFSQLIVLFKLAAPIILGNIAYATLGITDIMMAGMAGTDDQAGVAIGGSFFFPAITFVIGMISALHPIISRFRGANEPHKIPNAHLHAMLSCLVVGLIIMVLLLIASTLISMDTSKRMEEVTKMYVVTVAFTIPIAALFNSSRAFCEAMENTSATMYFGLLAVLLNVPLNYIFIFGKFGFPELGGIGCGVATLLSMSISTMVIFAYMRLHPKLKDYSWMRNQESLSWSKITDFIKLAFPLGVSTSVETSCFTIISLLLSPLGPIAVSSHTITLSMTSFIFNIPLSVGIATSIMVGYALGQNNLNTLRLNIKAAYASMLICISISCAILLSGRNLLPSFFTTDPVVLAASSALMYFAASNQVFESIQTIQAFVLRGFKDTNTILLVTIVAFYLVALPLGISLCYGYIVVPLPESWGGSTALTGPKGFWIGLFSGLVTASILYRFRVLHHYRQVKAALKKQEAMMG